MPASSSIMQPVQDLTIDSTVGRRNTLHPRERQSGRIRRPGTPKLLERLRQMPELADIASNTQDAGAGGSISSSTATTAGAIRHHAGERRQALYDAFGQRIVSTIYTQSNQYRVILEVDPKLQQLARSPRSLYLPSSSSAARPGAAVGHRRTSNSDRAVADQPFRPVPGDHDLLQCCARRIAGRGGRRDRARPKRTSACRKASSPRSRAPPLAFQRR